MIYCKWGPDSDVYLFRTSWGGYLCCCCLLLDGTSWGMATPKEALEHLQKHSLETHLVLDHAVDLLLEEIE